MERNEPRQHILQAMFSYLQVSPDQLAKLQNDPGPQALLFEQLQAYNMPSAL